MSGVTKPNDGLSYADQSQDDIGWYNLMRGGIYLHYNQCQIDYIKEGTYRKMGINRSIYFILKLLQMEHEQWLYMNGLVHERGGDGILQR